MKKSLLSLAGIIALSAVSGWIASAQLDVSELFYDGQPLVDDAFQQALNQYDSSRWFSSSSTIDCDSSNGINIVVPAVDDMYVDKVKIYRLFMSPYRLSQLKDGDPTVDTSKVIMKEVTIDENATEVKFDISAADVDPTTAYYGFILPIDAYDSIWTPSEEACFQLNGSICLKNSECDTMSALLTPVVEETDQPEVTWEHGAAGCVSMELANVRHTSDGKNITLTWTAVNGGENVDIAIFNPEQEIFEKLATVKMSDERYVYPMRWNGVQNFMLTNDCGEVKYKADEGIKEWEPEKIVTPATWPAENVLYIAIAAIVLYGAYVVFFRKSEN